MTYSIVARDPVTGRFGVAVQSHYLGVGPSCRGWRRASAPSRPRPRSTSPSGRSASSCCGTAAAPNRSSRPCWRAMPHPRSARWGSWTRTARRPPTPGRPRSPPRAISSVTGSRSRATSSSATRAGRRWPKRTRPRWPRASRSASASCAPSRRRRPREATSVDGRARPSSSWTGHCSRMRGGGASSMPGSTIILTRCPSCVASSTCTRRMRSSTRRATPSPRA